MKKRTPLYSRLLELKAQGRSSFHTPGHKCSGFFPEFLIELDYTELPETDALFEANGVIRETEELLSELFGTRRTLISAGGCSLAIQAMIRLASMRGGKFLCARNAHRSAINAMALLGIDPVWISPAGGNGYTGRIKPEDVKRAFLKNPGITACYITSPSYYGELCDIGSIAEICHSFGAALLVDNAHGSHLKFMKNDLHPISLGADMSACSLHKTLPVLTGGAVLNIANSEFVDGAKAAMSLFGSTSPSYPIMCSIDLCADYFINGSGTEDYQSCEEKVAQLKALAFERGIAQPQGSCDPLRLTVGTNGMSREQQEEFFRSRGIDCEFCDGKNAVMICTPFNSENDFQRLQNAINDIPCGENINSDETVSYIPERVMTLRDAMMSDHEGVPVIDAAGKIAADTVCPCPPGVPVIMPGELIDEGIVKQLLSSSFEDISVVRPRHSF